MSISVCMASYNGENFIEKQIKSILLQLSSSDELIIVDDCSTDRTVERINAFKDSRIQLVQNISNSGEILSFSKAISLSKNKYIFEYVDSDLDELIDKLESIINNYGFKNLIDDLIHGLLKNFNKHNT